jgi:hypothetical protein
MANFGWADPNRVVSQAVIQKIAAGHPKFGAVREVRASTWEFALIASRLDAPRVLKKSFLLKNKKTQKRRQLEAGFPLRACVCHKRTQAVGLGLGGRACMPSERVSLQPRADERACPMSSIRNLSWPSQWRFQKSARIHPKFELAGQSVVIKNAHPKLSDPNTSKQLR